MGKHCIYCKTDIDEDSVVDVCQRCGISVWGHKMFAAIVENMQGARDAGDLYQGSVTDPDVSKSNSKQRKSGLSSIAQEALATQEAAPVERQLDSFPTEPTKEDIPPLVDSFSKPESFGPEKEINPTPPQASSFSQQPSPPTPSQTLSPPTHPEPFPQQVRPEIRPQTEDSSEESASFFIDNMNKGF
ncbi:MAG: hypothetical protein ABH864_06295 [archaeon]